MDYGDEYTIDIPPEFDLDSVSAANLSKLFKHARRVTRFDSAPDDSFFQDLTFTNFGELMSYKIDKDCIIEINHTFLRSPIVIRNQVSDLISFQFVSSLKRSEFLGERKNVHDMGPAVIVSAVPNKETTYRVPKTSENIRHVGIHTTLSNLMERMGESKDDYPDWLKEILNGDYEKPRQRVLFLEDIHRHLLWPCFNSPVSGALLNYWMSAKFQELLCIGLQILKNPQPLVIHHPSGQVFPHQESIRKCRTILNLEYAHPPSLPALAHTLGLSETQLKSGFKSMNGTTVLQYCINRRIEAAKLLLSDNRQSISEVADIVGYEDHSAFSRAFRRLCGCSPQQWRNQTHND